MLHSMIGVLVDHEESELTMFLIRSAKIGVARNRKQVLAIVRGAVAKKQDTDPEEVHITIGWGGFFS